MLIVHIRTIQDDILQAARRQAYLKGVGRGVYRVMAARRVAHFVQKTVDPYQSVWQMSEFAQKPMPAWVQTTGAYENGINPYLMHIEPHDII